MTGPEPQQLSDERRYQVVFEQSTKRPWCVLLQAAAGGDHHAVSRFFDPGLWHVAPTDNPVLVAGTADELRALNCRLREVSRG